jgi:hypothetical protein
VAAVTRAKSGWDKQLERTREQIKKKGEKMEFHEPKAVPRKTKNIDRSRQENNMSEPQKRTGRKVG